MRRFGILVFGLLGVAILMVGCARVRVNAIAPLTMNHTYSIALATSFKPDDTAKKVVATMKEVMEFEVQRFNPIVAHPLYLKDPVKKVGDIPKGIRDESDALFLFDGIDYTPPSHARLVLRFRVWEFASGYKGPRTITVDCDCQGMNSREALTLLAKQATRYILREIWGPPDTDLPSGLGGLTDFTSGYPGGGF